MPSILTDTPIQLDLTAVRKGLSWAQSWSTGPVLCRIRNQKMQFIAVNDRRFLASWAWDLPNTEANFFFLIPPFVIATITSPAAYDADSLQVIVRKNLAGLILGQGKQEFRLQWRWDAATFHPPPSFEQMLQMPTDILQAPYVAIADVVHLALANLVIETSEHPGEQAAIEIDFSPGQFNIDGLSVTMGQAHRFFFDPRMVTRGMEIARGDQIGFAMQPVSQDRVILYFTSERDGCRIHVAIFSLPSQNQSFATTTLTLQETPTSGGVFVMPRNR